MPLSNASFKKLAAHHGLDIENSSDSDVDGMLANAITDDEMTDLANRVVIGEAAIEQLDALRNSQVVTDLKTYANRIGEGPDVEAHWKPQLLANRDIAIKAIEKIPAPATIKQPLHNRATAGTPKTIENGGKTRGTANEAVEIRNKVNEIRRDYLANNKRSMDYTTAFKQARTELGLVTA